jgi:hypothetical protein
MQGIFRQLPDPVHARELRDARPAEVPRPEPEILLADYRRHQ